MTGKTQSVGAVPLDLSRVSHVTSDEKKALTDAEIEARLPKPVGYRILIALPEIEETYAGSGILKSSKEMHKDYIMSIMGVVVDMGDDCYKDKPIPARGLV